MCHVFECERCGCADSINCTHTTAAGYVCAECLTGEWHGMFPKEQYSFEIHGPALNKQNPDHSFTSFS